MPQITLITAIAAPIDDCFQLSLSVDAHTASMGRSAGRAVGGVTHGTMAADDTVTWQARHFGLPFRMTSHSSAYSRPTRFVDEQVKGPFDRWWHEHIFEPLGLSATRMVDRVDFRSPMGLVGRAVDGLVLTGYMQRLLEQRNDWLKSTLERPAGQ